MAHDPLSLAEAVSWIAAAVMAFCVVGSFASLAPSSVERGLFRWLRSAVS
jgi:hypothetical protein